MLIAPPGATKSKIAKSWAATLRLKDDIYAIWKLGWMRSSTFSAFGSMGMAPNSAPFRGDNGQI
jgi:hypothetical protein